MEDQRYLMPFIKNVLILAVNPRDTQQLDLLEEVKAIKEILGKGIQNVTFNVEVKIDIEPGQILPAIRGHRPQIIHFCGHGEDFELVFADENQAGKSVKGHNLVDLFSQPKIQGHLECVVLNACYSAKQASWVGRVVDYSIGSLHAIKDRAAIQFSKSFYSAIVTGNAFKADFFDEAFHDTKASMSSEGIKDSELLQLHKRRLIPSLEPNIESLLLSAGLRQLVSEILYKRASKSKAPLGRSSTVEHDVLRKLRKIIQSLPGIKKYSGDVYAEAWEDLWDEIKDELRRKVRKNGDLDAEAIVRSMNRKLEEKMKKYERNRHKYIRSFFLGQFSIYEAK